MASTSPRPTATDRARSAVLVASGRATAASVVLSSALDMVDAARAAGDLQVSDLARERLSRLVLEGSATVNAIRRELEALLNDPTSP